MSFIIQVTKQVSQIKHIKNNFNIVFLLAYMYS